MSKPITSVASRFWPRVNFNGPNGCWEWLGQKNEKGYGIIGLGGKNCKSIKAHCFSYLTLVCPIPEGFVVDHTCHNPSCVNPSHLEAVTQAVNLQRGISFNKRKTHCPKGHELFGDNLYVFVSARGSSRSCKECHRQNCRVSDARKRIAA